MSRISKMFRVLLALVIFATASLAIPSAASAKSHGNHHASSLMKKHKIKKHKHKKHKHKHHKHKKHGGSMGGQDDDDDDDDDATSCKIVWTKRGPVQVCNTDDDDDD
jgi:Ni/Co efflux regulator RcnB